MGTAPRDSISKESLSKPGPGNYDPKLITSKGGIRFGSSTRKPLNDPNASPGPGSYNIPSKMIEGPKVTSLLIFVKILVCYHLQERRPRLKVRQKFARTWTIYPFNKLYQRKSPSIRVYFFLSTFDQFRIGSGNRSDLYKTGQAPGPGHYNLRGRSEGPKWG
jgi:hypothetical protein